MHWIFQTEWALHLILHAASAPSLAWSGRKEGAF